MISDYFKYSVKSLTSRGIRSWLTMLGIFVGIAAVVSLISLGQGMKDAMNAQFEMMGTDIIMVMPGAGFFSASPGGSAATLTDDDKEAIERLRGVELAGGMITQISKTEYKGVIKYTWVSGLPTDKSQKIIEDMQSVEIREGRKFNPSDKWVAIVGYLIGEGELYDKKVDIGDKVILNDKSFKVIGTLESLGNSQDDNSYWIPLDASKELFDTEDYIAIMVRSKDNFDPADVAEDIKEKLRKTRDVEEGDEDFSVQTSEELKESVGVILDAVQWFLVGTSLISLLVGGIGIMNTMYTSVLERTKEIGVMKAVGAKNGDITLLFLIESGVVGVVGGIVGSVIGIGLSKMVEFASAQAGAAALIQAHISIELVGGALLLSFIVGALSGVLPARQAAKLRPVDALRYE